MIAAFDLPENNGTRAWCRSTAAWSSACMPRWRAARSRSPRRSRRGRQPDAAPRISRDERSSVISRPMLNLKARPCDEVAIRATGAVASCAGQQQALGAGRHHPGVDHFVYRRIGRERRAADHRGRSENLGRRHPMAGQRLHAFAHRAGADRRRGRRSVRPPPRVHRRHRDVRRRLAVVRACPPTSRN